MVHYGPFRCLSLPIISLRLILTQPTFFFLTRDDCLDWQHDEQFFIQNPTIIYTKRFGVILILCRHNIVTKKMTSFHIRFDFTFALATLSFFRTLHFELLSVILS